MEVLQRRPGVVPPPPRAPRLYVSADFAVVASCCEERRRNGRLRWIGVKSEPAAIRQGEL
jgi:hypothetical protein